MKILAIADRAPQIDIRETVDREKIDLIMTLGDLERSDILQLADIHDVPKIGVYGNHCSGNYMEDMGILNMHMATWRFREFVFGGFEGCVRYKENPDAIMYTQQEASAMFAQLPPVDILLCHCPPRGINDEEELAHQGFDGSRAYIDRTPPKLLLHGHTYPTENDVVRQYGSTRIEYVYKWKVVEV